MPTRPIHHLLLAATLLLTACATDTRNRLLISIPDQRLLHLRDNIPLATYPVSTSKFGLGDTPGSHATPLGLMRVRQKIGHNAPTGTVFKSRKPTGEILPPNAPGRDPIVTRILWLDGLQPTNRNTFHRHIYIHGTPQESSLGTPASYGCIRMRSRDIIHLFDQIGPGTQVLITQTPLPPP